MTFLFLVYISKEDLKLFEETLNYEINNLLNQNGKVVDTNIEDFIIEDKEEPRENEFDSELALKSDQKK